MTESYAARMAKYAGKRKVIERPVLSVQAPVSAEVMSRTMGTPAQRAMMQNTADIFSKSVISSDPIAQVGALDARQGDMQNFPNPARDYAVTYNDNYLPSDLTERGREEAAMIRGAGYNIANLKNKIAIGPEAMAGEAPATIPHELGHRGVNILRELYAPQRADGFFGTMNRFQARMNLPVSDETPVRVISIMRGEEVPANLQYMNNQHPRADGRPWTADLIRQEYGDEIAKLQNQATSYLRERGLK